MAENSTS